MILQSAFSSLLPSADETELLRACLHDGASAAESWRRWRSRRPAAASDVCVELAERRTLMPLLADSAAQNGLDIGQDVMAYLQAVTLREELRTERYQAIAAEALRLLERADVVPLVVGGSALSFTAYRVPAQRHCHDLDLLVRPTERDKAVHALTQTGFSSVSPVALTRGGTVLEHTSGLPIAIHTQIFAGMPDSEASDDVFLNSRPAGPGDLQMRVPSPELMLVHVLGHAPFGIRRGKHRWIADSWHVVRRYADLDWAKVLTWISAFRLDIPASALIAHLAAFGLAVPSDVLASVTEQAEKASRTGEDFAIGYLSAAMHHDIKRLWRYSDSWRTRLRLLNWFVLPSREYLRSTVGSHAAWLTPVFYLYRPLRSMAARMARHQRYGRNRTYEQAVP